MIDRQQAITWLEQIKVKYIHGGDEEFDDCRIKSIDMAIEALRQLKIVREYGCEVDIAENKDPYGALCVSIVETLMQNDVLALISQETIDPPGYRYAWNIKAVKRRSDANEP